MSNIEATISSLEEFYNEGDMSKQSDFYTGKAMFIAPNHNVLTGRTGKELIFRKLGVKIHPNPHHLLKLIFCVLFCYGLLFLLFGHCLLSDLETLFVFN